MDAATVASRAEVRACAQSASSVCHARVCSLVRVPLQAETAGDQRVRKVAALATSGDARRNLHCVDFILLRALCRFHSAARPV
jgi:hypothetical protein